MKNYLNDFDQWLSWLKINDDKGFFTVTDTAKILRCHPQRITEMLDNGELSGWRSAGERWNGVHRNSVMRRWGIDPTHATEEKIPTTQPVTMSNNCDFAQHCAFKGIYHRGPFTLRQASHIFNLPEEQIEANLTVGGLKSLNWDDCEAAHYAGSVYKRTISRSHNSVTGEVSQHIR
ncbi:DNA-binding protein [Holophaga foetida]|uniref:DNA-binding protein n=1 Tax=Holophaga foetida TaxID=35839 RepID=UPI0002474961|nr:DNA-binding protein [Holophaga foetida]